MSYIVGRGVVTSVSELLGETGDQVYAFASVEGTGELIFPDVSPPITVHRLMVFGEEARAVVKFMKIKGRLSIVFAGRYTTMRKPDAQDDEAPITEISAEIIGLNLLDSIMDGLSAESKLL